MRTGDKYHHFKNNDYIFTGIALPLHAGLLDEETKKQLEPVGTVRYHENTHDLKLFALDRALFIDSDVAFVIYQSLKDNMTDCVWAREVDDYFGFKNKGNGEWVKKFTLVKEGVKA